MSSEEDNVIGSYCEVSRCLVGRFTQVTCYMHSAKVELLYSTTAAAMDMDRVPDNAFFLHHFFSK
jgi:hypothetical protein